MCRILGSALNLSQTGRYVNYDSHDVKIDLDAFRWGLKQNEGDF